MSEAHLPPSKRSDSFLARPKSLRKNLTFTTVIFDVETWANFFNDLIHTPYIEDIAYYIYWGGFLGIVCPLTAFLLMPALFLYDLFTGMIGPGPTVKPPADKQGAILITGCDSGFGHDLALELAFLGWKVYAGCLSAQGQDSLRSKAGEGEILIPVQMNVCDNDQIAAVMKQIEKENPEGGLWALVNNAGIADAGLVDWSPMETFRKVMEVNYFALINVTKHALPLLKKYSMANRKKGARVINMTSISGITPGFAATSAYTSSKHAAEAICHSLRHELAPWGIKVVAMNPAFHRTAIVGKFRKDLAKCFNNLSREQQEEYGESYVTRAYKASKALTEDSSWDPANVVKAMVHACTALKPRPSYYIGMDAKFTLQVLSLLPTRAVEYIMLHVIGAKRPRYVVELDAKAKGGKKGVVDDKDD